MYEKKRYNQMVFYWESCESGSMFNHLNKSINVFAESAANTHESSYAWYWDEGLRTFLGDLYSVNWMESKRQYVNSWLNLGSLQYRDVSCLRWLTWQNEARGRKHLEDQIGGWKPESRPEQCLSRASHCHVSQLRRLTFIISYSTLYAG